MPVQNIIFISIDGLRASALGAYGNTWHPTPALDALASGSIVYNWMFCERPTVAGFLDSAWREGDASLAQLASNAGVQTALTTDDGAVALRGERSGFSEVRQLELASSDLAATTADTELAQLFAVAIDQLASWAQDRGPAGACVCRRWLWLHARGYYGAWDAPVHLRQSLLDDEDPPAPSFVTPPSIAGITDHDELLLCRVAYAAQTMVLDECVGALTAALAEFDLAANTLVVLTGARGFALGEHGSVGGAATGLYSERLHVPCLLRVPGASAPPSRRLPLVQPRDFYSTLQHAAGIRGTARQAGVDLLSPDSADRDWQFVIATDENGEAVIRTAAWMLRRPGGKGTWEDASHNAVLPPAELYVKPDDRWEANEIASRMPEEAARLLAVLESSLELGDPDATPAPHDEGLARGIR